MIERFMSQLFSCVGPIGRFYLIGLVFVSIGVGNMPASLGMGWSGGFIAFGVGLIAYSIGRVME